MMIRKFESLVLLIFLCTFFGCSQEKNTQSIQQILAERITALEKQYEAYISENESGIKEGKKKLEDAELCLRNNLTFAGLYLSDMAETFLDNGVMTEFAKKNENNIEIFSEFWNKKKPEVGKQLNKYKKFRNMQNISFLKGVADINAYKARSYFQSGKYWLEMNNYVYSSIYTSRGVLYAKRAVDYLYFSCREKTDLGINLETLKEEYDRFDKILVDDYSNIIKGESEINDYLSPGAEINMGKKFIEKNYLNSALIELLSTTESYYLLKIKASKTVPDIEEYKRIKIAIEENFKSLNYKDLSIGEFFRQKGDFYFIKYEKDNRKLNYFMNSYVIYKKVLPLFFKLVEPSNLIITFVRWPFQ